MMLKLKGIMKKKKKKIIDGRKYLRYKKPEENINAINNLYILNINRLQCLWIIIFTITIFKLLIVFEIKLH